jgi:hypothetical protein
VDTYDQSLQFYLKRTTTMVAYRDELGFGIEQEPQKFIADIAGFESSLAGGADGLGADVAGNLEGFECEGISHDRSQSATPAASSSSKAMNAISFSLILTGVLLNAAAQLLLKAGTNVVGHFEFHADNIIPVGLKLAFQPLHHGRHGLLCSQPGGLDHGAVACSGLDRLPDAVHRLCDQRLRRLAVVRRSPGRPEAARHRLHRGRRVPGGKVMSLPFLPFTRPSIDEETIAAVADVMRSGWITSGPRVQAFEAALSDYCGGRPVRAFNSGTATLEVALRLAKVGAGDTVITTPLTWVATANVILEVGATPVLVDVDPVTRNIDLDRIEAAILPTTKAVIPVDLAGLPGRPRPAVRHRRQAQSPRDRGCRAIPRRIMERQPHRQHRDFVSFSFHANKNLTTAEGGALVLPD